MTIARLSETALREAQDAAANIYQIQAAPPQQEQVKFRLVYPAFPGCSSDPSTHNNLAKAASSIKGVQLEYFDMYLVEENAKGVLNVPGRIHKADHIKRVDDAIAQMDKWGLTPWGDRAVLLDANNNRIGIFTWSEPNFEQNIRNAISQYQQQPAQSRGR